MNNNDLVKAYLNLRDRKAKLKADYQAATADIDRALALIEAKLLTFMNENNLDSMKTEFGTPYKSTQTRVKVADWPTYIGFVASNELWSLLDRRANKDGVETYKAEYGELPPGIDYQTEVVINVRRN